MRTWGLCFLLSGCPIPEFPYPEAPPRIERFDALPFEVDPGDTVTLRWKVLGADRVEIGEQAVAAEGERELEADAATTFVLVATNGAGSSMANAAVLVRERRAVRIDRFEVTPTLVEPDDPVRVVWQTENATRVVLRLGTREVLRERAPDSGTLVFRPQRDVTVELFAEGWPEAARERRTIRARKDGPLIGDFHADPPILFAGDSFGLSWQVLDASHVRVLEETATSSIVLYEGDVTSETGYLPLVGTAGTHTFLLEAENAAGAVVESTKAFVYSNTPPEILSLTATPTVTGPGGDIVIEWLARAELVFLEDIGGSTFFTGGPSGTYVYRGVTEGVLAFRLTAVGDFMSVYETVDVLVSEDLPAIRSFEAPSGAAPSSSIVVTFETENADETLLETDYGATLLTTTATAGSFALTVEQTVGLVLNARNRRGDTVARRLVIVGPPVQITSFTATSTIVRLDRPIELSWETVGATSAVLDLSGVVQVPVSGSTRRSAPFLGIVQAQLYAIGLLGTATATLAIEVIQNTYGADEPNDTEAVAAGLFFSFPWLIEGSLIGDDADLFVVQPSLGQRLTIATAPPGGCQGGVAADVFETDPILGLLGPRIVDDRGAGCATLDQTMTATLESPYVIRLRRPTGTSTATETSYQLFLSSQDGVCGDGIIDLIEDCDDADLDAGDGCDLCVLEGTSEVEPNDAPVIATPVISLPITGFLGFPDRDVFALTVTSAGQRTISLGPSTCGLDAELTLFEAGVLIARSDNGGLGCAELTGPDTILSPGVYHLEVARGRGRFLTRRGPYVIQVR